MTVKYENVTTGRHMDGIDHFDTTKIKRERETWKKEEKGTPKTTKIMKS